jgi:hypothetical protein
VVRFLCFPICPLCCFFSLTVNDMPPSLRCGLPGRFVPPGTDGLVATLQQQDEKKNKLFFFFFSLHLLVMSMMKPNPDSSSLGNLILKYQINWVLIFIILGWRYLIIVQHSSTICFEWFFLFSLSCVNVGN